MPTTTPSVTTTTTEPTIGPATDTSGGAPGIPVTPTTVAGVVVTAATQTLFGAATFGPNAVNGPDSLNNRVFSTGGGMITDSIAEGAGIDPSNPRFGLAVSFTQAIAPFAFTRAGLAGDQGILSAAARGRGNFGLGSASSETAMRLGRAWVGKGYRLASDGKTLVSADGLRAFRPPSFKPRLGKIQANFEQRPMPSGKWISNGHLDVP